MAEHEEVQYLRLIEKILAEGVVREDRTGVGTKSVFGAQMRFSLHSHFPLLTTKRVFWRGVAEELIWFIGGNTDARKLQNKNIHIWDGNSSKAYLERVGLGHRAAGDLGPVYGFQWRHWGAAYEDFEADYAGKGLDQLQQAIDTIRTNPSSRRIIVSAWNPTDIPEMALPPCHMTMQFYVAEGRLSCMMMQRSADMGLGVPFNIASYALLTYIIADLCNLQPGELIHTIGDAHVYLNHVEGLQEQLKRTPTPFPKLTINRHHERIEDYCFEDFTLSGYNPGAKIALPFAA